jgi:phosphohistidine phosphatase
MNLYFIRHSIAEKISIEKLDFDRELTEEGIIVLNKSVEVWKNYIETLDVILTSPLIRSVQTAKIISDSFNKPEIIIDNSLSLGCKTKEVSALVNTFKLINIAVVGHQPDLSFHINHFCGIGNFNLKFPPASIAKIEFDNKSKISNGRLVFFLPPMLH